MTSGYLRHPLEERKKLLIYAANIHPRSILSPTTCTAKSSLRYGAAWIFTILPQLDNYLDTEIVQTYTERAHIDVDEAGVGRAPRPADTTGFNTEGAAGPTQQLQQQQAATRGK
jgi:hypothetical protein